MEEENNGNTPEPDDEKPGSDNAPTSQNKQHSGTWNKYSDGRIIGVNLLVMVGYTFLAAFGLGGGIIVAPFLFIHVLFCFVSALTYKRWVWALSALAVLLIGASSCVGLMSISHY